MGDCYLREGKQYCVCKIGFTGTRCDQLSNPCACSPCDEGTCIKDNTRGDAFRCDSGGSEEGISCDLSPCSNGEVCVNNGSSGYYCKMPAYQQGRNQTPCDSGPCPNGQICVNQGTNRYHCQNPSVKESNSPGILPCQVDITSAKIKMFALSFQLYYFRRKEGMSMATVLS